MDGTQAKPGRTSLSVKLPLVLLLLGVLLAHWFWERSGELMLDFGRELYISWQVSQGKLLYQQLDYRFGPLAVSANALWMHLFGPGIETILFTNLLVLLLTGAMLFALLSKISNRFTATMAMALFLCVFAFSHGTPLTQYNFLTPYNHGATYGLMLGVAAVLAVGRVARTRASIDAAMLGVLCGLCFLTKPEMFLACAAAAACGLIACSLQSIAQLLRLAAVALVSAALPVVAAFGALAQFMPWKTALAGTLGGWQFIANPNLVNSKFYRWCLGTDDLHANLLRMLGSAGAYAVLVLALIALAYLARNRRRVGMALGALVALLLAGLLLLDHGQGKWIWSNLDRGLPLAMGAAVLASAMTLWRQRHEPASAANVLRFSWAIFSLALLMKMIFAVRTTHYGFVLAAPAALTALVALMHGLPRALRWGVEAEAVFRLAAIGLLLGVVSHRLTITAAVLRARTASTPLALGGQIRLSPPDIAAAPFIDAVRHSLPPGSTLAVFPDSSGLNYATARPTSIPYTVFNPWEVMMTGERAIIAALQQSPPDFVAIVATDESEYGATTFGLDYGVKIQEWIDQHYIVMQIFRGKGAGVQVRQISLLRRR